MKAIFQILRPASLKDYLAIICILAFVWLVFWGNFSDPAPNYATLTVFVIGAVSFSILFFLRTILFISWVTKKR